MIPDDERVTFAAALWAKHGDNLSRYLTERIAEQAAAADEQAHDQITLWANTDIVRVFIDDVLQETASASLTAPAGLTKAMLHTVFDAQPPARLGGRPLPSTARISIWSKLKGQLGF